MKVESSLSSSESFARSRYWSLRKFNVSECRNKVDKRQETWRELTVLRWGTKVHWMEIKCPCRFELDGEIQVKVEYFSFTLKREDPVHKSGSGQLLEVPRPGTSFVIPTTSDGIYTAILTMPLSSETDPHVRFL